MPLCATPIPVSISCRRAVHRFSEGSGDPDGEYTRKLYHLTSLLNTEDDPEANPIKDWKLELVTAREVVRTR